MMDGRIFVASSLVLCWLCLCLELLILSGDQSLEFVGSQSDTELFSFHGFRVVDVDRLTTVAEGREYPDWWCTGIKE